MNKVNDFLTKYVVYAIWIVCMLALFSTCNSCSSVRTANKALKEADTTAAQLKALQTQIYTKEELDIRLEILGLETSKRTLYDWNAVVRTAVRPDDQMNLYDKQIKDLQAKLK
jgi:hypothetical protein